MSALPSSLPPDIQQFVADQIAQGKYRSASDVACAAIRLMQDRESRLESLRRDIDLGIAQLNSGDCIELNSESDLQKFFDDMELRMQQRLSAQ